jgi:micrococcal nuclease
LGYIALKKLLVVFIATLLFGCVSSKEQPWPQEQTGSRTVVILDKCVDGDTAWFYPIGKARFLYIDTPEIYPQLQPYGQQAADFTCDRLTSAKVIQIEYDGTREDSYGRQLVWVWVDGDLLQEELALLGLVIKLYDYDDYRYEKRVDDAINKAKKNKAGIYQ